MKGGDYMQVRVKGWGTPRSILEKENRVFFEIAETDGCPTCQSRIMHVDRVLKAKSIPADFRLMPSSYGPCLYVVLDSPLQGVDVKSYVGQLLDLAIS